MYCVKCDEFTKELEAAVNRIPHALKQNITLEFDMCVFAVNQCFKNAGLFSFSVFWYFSGISSGCRVLLDHEKCSHSPTRFEILLLD